MHTMDLPARRSTELEKLERDMGIFVWLSDPWIMARKEA